MQRGSRKSVEGRDHRRGRSRARIDVGQVAWLSEQTIYTRHKCLSGFRRAQLETEKCAAEEADRRA